MGMLAAIGKWFITSKWGLTILLALAIAASALITYNLVVGKAYDRGVFDCNAKHTVDALAATLEQDRKNRERNTQASDIAKTADTAGDVVVKTADTKSTKAKEVIRYVYRDAPRTKPVAPGSCVHPVDDRVQDQFRKAVDSANGQ